MFGGIFCADLLNYLMNEQRARALMRLDELVLTLPIKSKIIKYFYSIYESQEVMAR